LRSVRIEPAPDTLEDNPLFATASLSNGAVRSAPYTRCADVIKKKKEKKEKEKKERKKEKKRKKGGKKKEKKKKKQ